MCNEKVGHEFARKYTWEGLDGGMGMDKWCN